MAPTDLPTRTTALQSAVDAAEGRLPSPLLDEARAVVARARERGALSAEHTVVALAGSTGSGKSSLFNTIVGTDFATTGVQRPTTSRALAAVWGEGAEPLLDWLEVVRRHEMSGPKAVAANAGLVLLDLPDHDSVVPEHRIRAERLVERVDLLVWVVDPQKYADAALHERYLRSLAGHGDVVVVVLNQIDRLSPQDAAACLADLRRLVTDDGLAGARVLGTSARTGQGVGELKDLLAQAAARREAATARLVADERAAARRVLDACGEPVRSGSAARSRDRLVDALEGAAGVETVVTAVRASANREARAATGWPVTRWIGKLRPDPLRRIGLRSAIPQRGAARRAAPDRPDLARTSLPAPPSALRAGAQSAVRAYVDAVTTGAPDPWVLSARARAADGARTLPDALDQAVAGTQLEAERRPVWWRLVNVLQWIALIVLAAGLLWLGTLAVLAYLQVPRPPTPTWHDWPWPTLMVTGGVVVGIVVALLSRGAAALGARRRAARARKRLRESIGRVADEAIRRPVDAELAELETCRAAAKVAAG